MRHDGGTCPDEVGCQEYKRSPNERDALVRHLHLGPPFNLFKFYTSYIYTLSQLSSQGKN